MRNVKTKAENYTAAETKNITAEYLNCGVEITESAHDKRAQVVEALAKKYGKGVRSIRSKLVAEKVYIARAKVSGVTGEKPEKKEALAARLVAATPFTASADSVAKMNKDTIQAFLTYFNDLIVEELESDNEPELSEA